jgi:hypothetical protein
MLVWTAAVVLLPTPRAVSLLYYISSSSSSVSRARGARGARALIPVGDRSRPDARRRIYSLRIPRFLVNVTAPTINSTKLATDLVKAADRRERLFPGNDTNTSVPRNYVVVYG